MVARDLRPVCAVGATLGEGPVWDVARGALWFVDIKGRRLHRFDPVTGALASQDAPAEIGWALPADDGTLLAGLQDGLWRFDPGGGGFAPFLAVEPDRPGNRLNDATVDAAGRLWFGSMDNGEAEASGRLYRFDDAGIIDSGLPPVVITNGPAFSPDGRTLYHTDTLGGVVHAAPVSEDGTVGAPRPFARIDPADGYPDGPAVDAEGCVWTGLFGGWGVRRYAPTGELIETMRFPVANVTKIAFGGPDLTTVYATTARKGLDAAALAAQPLAGDLFAFTVDVPGLATPLIRIAA
ncbi:SMP-30/gluconolactonase/LRE family protein [Sphingomonas naphthae]|uniref:SMP-30/gluconolactonase/LRE family protein n=1 Tax=Sphingomonas naphthae TaxID=1813468 RepID=A0ABY7TIR3_9SPHN|nr:SMP-30/gluconolactonase/LRE family protein [Sphingomonas naphthae]WCT73102.1 SMP-30/gluconolactonase/LRE family protein [Sphingomonas naphthae]